MIINIVVCMKRFLTIIITTLILVTGGLPADTFFGEKRVIVIADSPVENARVLLARSEEAHIKHDLESAKRLLIEALADNPTEEEKATAWQRLATLEWRFFAHYEQARAYLAQAEMLRSQRTETWLEKARLESSLSNFDEAYLAAQKAVLAAKDNKTLEKAKIALASVVVDKILQNRLYKPAAFNKTSRLKEQAQIVEANKLLRPIVRSAPGQFVPSRLQLTLALLLRNGPDVLMAWRSFFHIQENISGDSLLATTDRKLSGILRNWHKENAAPETVESLALALAESRLFEEAALIALEIPKNQIRSSRLKDFVEYALFCRRIQDLTNEYYRQTALKQGNADRYRKELLTEGEQFRNRLNREKGTEPKFDADTFMAEMSRRFGAEINLGMTAGYLDLHMGHRVIDEKRTITQYKYSADIRLIALDTIVSNGFQSWAWDGRAQHGGWATATEIIQVRPVYNGAFKTWSLLNDPLEKKRIDDEIVKDSLTDEAKASQNPYAFLPGLQKRLLRRGREGLLKRLQDQGLTGNKLRLSFLSEYEKASIESTIFAHEGRHAIDSKLKLDLSVQDREFRAKLSEIAFASNPCLNIASIFDANIGDDTPHGIANLKVMKGLVKWMEENSRLITGLDRSKPLLLQFDRLTDEQIRAAFRSMDPFDER